MSIYRKSVWLVKGLREYTKSGYESASKSFQASDLDGVSCAGRSIMITGANSGIGKVTALEVAKRGGTVHMVCRNQERGTAAVEEIKEASGNQDVHLHLLDMSEPGKVFQFAKEFQESGKPLHVLVNNAGCMENQRIVSEQGIEKNFATNTLGVHILTTSLIPVLNGNTDPRVVMVSSGGMLTHKMDTSDLQFAKLKPFDGTMAYAQNKRQQVVMTEMYSKKYPNIHFSVMHPGWADTPAVRSAMPDFYERMKNKLRTPEQGADTLVWLVVSPAATKQTSGQFFQDRKAVPTHLPLAWSKSTDAEKQTLMDLLDQVAAPFKTS